MEETLVSATKAFRPFIRIELSEELLQLKATMLYWKREKSRRMFLLFPHMSKNASIQYMKARSDFWDKFLKLHPEINEHTAKKLDATETTNFIYCEL